jgi:hypothetical protein
MTLVPSRAYDGVLYIDTVTPPEYLPPPPAPKGSPAD